MKNIFEFIARGNLEEIKEFFREEDSTGLMALRGVNGCTPLMYAIQQNQREIFDFLLTHCRAIDVNAADDAPNKVLAYTVGQERYYMDRLFDQFNADLDVQSLSLALGYYTTLGDISKVELCLACEKADVNRGGFDMPPLVTAIWAQHENLVDVFLERPELDINRANSFKESALIVAIMFAEQSVIDKIFSRKDLDILQNSYFFSTALTSAVFKRQFAWAEKLIDREVRKYESFDVVRHPGLINCLIKQRHHGLLGKVLSLQKNKASINILPPLATGKIQDGLAKEEVDYPQVINSYQPGSDLFKLPSVLAVRYGDVESVRLLLDAGVDFSQQNTFGLSAYDYDKSLLIIQAQEAQDQILLADLVKFMQEGDFNSFKQKFIRLTDKNIQDKEGMTLLHYAFVTPNTQNFTTLLAAEQDSNIRNKQGDTALLHALRSSYCWYDNIRAFFEADKIIDCDLTMQGAEGSNALHLAIINDHLCMLRFLQSHENDHRVAQANAGKTAEQLADQDSLTLKLLEWPHTSDMQVEQMTELFEDNLFLPLSQLSDRARAWCATLIKNPDANYNFSIEHVESTSLTLNRNQVGAMKILLSLLKQKSESFYYQASVVQMAKIGALNEQDIMSYYQRLAFSFAKMLERDIPQETRSNIARTIERSLMNVAKSNAVQKPGLELFIQQINEATEKMRDTNNIRGIYNQLLTRARLYQQIGNKDFARKDINEIYDLYVKLTSATNNRMQKLSYALSCLEYHPEKLDVIITYLSLVIELNNKRLVSKAIERVQSYERQIPSVNKDVKVTPLLRKLQAKQNKMSPELSRPSLGPTPRLLS